MSNYSTILAFALTAATAAFSHGAGFETLTHHWNFDEGPDWHDDPFQSVCAVTVARDNVGTVHATLQGMDASAWVSGRQYTGLSFDGADDSLLTGADLSTDLSGTSSFSFWLKTTQTGADSSTDAPGILGSAGIQWGWLDTDGKIVFSVNGTPVVRTAGAVNDGNWHHIILTRDSGNGTAQVFLDGQLSATATGPTGTQGGMLTRIGQMQNGSTASFQGRLDQIHVFTSVVDATTIAALFDNQAPKTWDVNHDLVVNTPISTGSVLVSTYAHDVEQDPISFYSFTQPAHGSASYNGDGSFTYTPNTDFIGTDSFTATIIDGRGGFTTNSVNLEILPEALPNADHRTILFTDFQAIQAGGVDIALEGKRMPRFIDWDADGDLDILIGHSTGVWRYENTGTPTAPVFAAGVKVQAEGSDIVTTGSISLVDITGDGVDDLIGVNSSKNLLIYRNTSAIGEVPVYAAATIAQTPADTDFVLDNDRIGVSDWDLDGKLDILVGSKSNGVNIHYNIGTTTDPRFETDGHESLTGGSFHHSGRTFDINRDGKYDFIRSRSSKLDLWYNQADLGITNNNNTTIYPTYSDGTRVPLNDFLDGPFPDFADLNGDGIYDLILGGRGGSENLFITYGKDQRVASSIAIIEAIYDAHPTGLGDALEANEQALLNQIKDAGLNIVMNIGEANRTERDIYYTQILAHVSKYPFFQMDSPQEDDPTEYHHIPSLAAQNLIFLKILGSDTPTHRLFLADTFGMTGIHRDIFLEYGLHVGDNKLGYERQLVAIRDFMRFQPREVFPDTLLTINNFINNDRDGLVESFTGSKNVFSKDVDASTAGLWDEDKPIVEEFYGAPVYKGSSCVTVLGHEVTHSLDGYVGSRANGDLVRRKSQWFNMAGGPDIINDVGVDGANDEHQGWNLIATKAHFKDQGYWDGDSATWEQAWEDYWYGGPGTAFRRESILRIHIKFFLENPQEGMASVGNQHWPHSMSRMIVALDRWAASEENGIEEWKMPVTEVLTFFDWVSAGMNKCVMFDEEAAVDVGSYVNFNPSYAWFERNENGYITKVTVDGQIYEFTVDDYGVVTGIVQCPGLRKPDERFFTLRDTPNIIKPLENDRSLDGSTLIIESFTQPEHGTVIHEGDGVFIYTPDLGHTGLDSFTYKINDQSNASSTVSWAVAAPVDPLLNSILMETWTGISGNHVSQLKESISYPSNPDDSEARTLFEAPLNRIGANFGTRMSGILTPPTTGDYTFWIAADYTGELWLAEDDAGTGDTLIAFNESYTGSREWTKYPSQESIPITLQAGKSYQITALQKDTISSDHLAVAWQGPGIAQELVPASVIRIPSRNHAPVLVTPVPNITVVENAAETVLDISGVFYDQDHLDSVSSEITSNINPSLVTPSIVGDQLILAYAPGQYGTTTITLRGYDLGGAITTTSFTVTVLADSDGDGMPDTWESTHGLNPGIDDAEDNKDGDRFDNYSEYVAGTDPSDPSSFLSLILEVTSATGDRDLRFQSSLGRRYTVETRDDLVTGTWTPLGPSVDGTGDEIIIQDTAAFPNRFYRLRVGWP